MSIKNWPGGFVQPIPPTPAGPFQDGAAPGVWTLDQVAYWTKQGLWPTAGNIDTSNRGVFAGGSTGSTKNTIDYIAISTTGNATDFGDLATGVDALGSCSSSTRGVFAGGTAAGRVNVIQYITIASVGNATDFGDLTGPNSGESTGLSGCSNSTRGVFGGGNDSNDFINNLQYITIASVGNTTDFGDLTQGTNNSGSLASTTRGVWGASSSNTNNVISYITIATTGNATYFGDLLSGLQSAPKAGCSNSTRGLFVGAPINTINYITIASTGNATDFGDMLYNPGTFGPVGACATSTRATFGGGFLSSFINTINYVTISSTGNATDFGDLSAARSSLAGCSNAHGGL